MPKFCTSLSIALVVTFGVASCSKPQQKSEAENNSTTVAPAPSVATAPTNVAAGPTTSKPHIRVLSCDYKDGDTLKNSKFLINRDANIIDFTVADGLPHPSLVNGTSTTARISDDEYELKYDIPSDSDGHRQSRDFKIDRHSQAFEIDFVDYSETPPVSYSVNGTCQDVTGQTPTL